VTRVEQTFSIGVNLNATFTTNTLEFSANFLHFKSFQPSHLLTLLLELFFLALLLSVARVFASCVNPAYCGGDVSREGLDGIRPTGSRTL